MSRLEGGGGRGGHKGNIVRFFLNELEPKLFQRIAKNYFQPLLTIIEKEEVDEAKSYDLTLSMTD